MYCCCWNTKASSPAESERSLRRLALPHSSRQSATMKPVSVLPRVPHHEVLLDDLVTVLHLAELPQSSFASSILPRSLLSTTMIRLFALWLLWHHKQVILSRLPTSHTLKHEFTVSFVEPMVKDCQASAAPPQHPHHVVLLVSWTLQPLHKIRISLGIQLLLALLTACSRRLLGSRTASWYELLLLLFLCGSS